MLAPLPADPLPENGLPDASAPVPAASHGATARLRLRIAEILSGLDDHFTRIGGTLERTVGAVSDVVNALGQIGAALQGDDGSGAVDNLARAARRLHDVSDQVAARAGQVERIRAISLRLATEIHELHRTLEALKIYGMNVKIAAFGARDFVDFADLMGQKLDAGKADVEGFHGRLAELESGLTRMTASDRELLRECARVVPQVPDRLVREAKALQHHQDALATQVRSTAAIAATIQTRVATVLGAIQIGDIARQRLEHVLAGCEMLDALPADADPGVTGHMLALLHAQLDDTAQDFRRETLVLVGSLRELEPEANRLLALQARPDQGASDDAAFLRELEAGIAEATAMIAQLQEADRQADDTLALIGTTIEDLTARAAAIRHLRVDVQLMAINIGLSCRRVEAIGRPMTVIANEIRSHAEKLDGAVAHIGSAAGELATCSGAMCGDVRAGETGTGDALAHSLAMIREGASRTEQAVAMASRQSDTIGTLLRQTRDELEVSLDLASTIDALAQDTASHTGAGDVGALEQGAAAALVAMLETLGRSYTMASERVVHDRFRLPGMAALVNETALPGVELATGASSDDDDDALFDDALF